MNPNINANYRAALARRAMYRPQAMTRPAYGFRSAIADPFAADAALAGGLRGMGEGETDFLTSITDKLKSTVDIAGMQVPVWGLVAAGVGALFFLKK